MALTLLLLNSEVLPLGAVRGDDLAADYGLLTWNFWHVTESFARGDSPYRTRLLFHPLGSNLAAHTLGPGFYPVGLASKVLLGGRPDYPLHAHRAAVVICFAGGLLLAYYALQALGASAVAALAAATGWAFAAFWRPILANPTLASACMIVPAATLLMARLAQKPCPSRAAALAAFAAGSVYLSEYFAAFCSLALLVVVAAGAVGKRSGPGSRAIARRVGWRGAALAAAAAALVAAPFLAAWSGSEGQPPRSRQLVVGGANIAGFVLPDPNVTPLYGHPLAARLQARVSRGRAPFLGIPTLLFAAAGVVLVRTPLRRVLLTTAAVFFVLSLGPVLKVLGTNTGLPLPYALLAQVPPFHMARDPARLAVFGIWAMLCLAALALTRVVTAVARRAGASASVAVAALALAWWAAEGYRPGARAYVFTPPPELSRLPPGAVASLPLTISDGLAMFLQVYHGRPIVTGYVSRVSPAQFEHVRRLQDLVDADPRAFVAQLRALGVGSLLLEPGTPEATASALAGRGLTVIDLRDGVDLR